MEAKAFGCVIGVQCILHPLVFFFLKKIKKLKIGQLFSFSFLLCYPSLTIVRDCERGIVSVFSLFVFSKFIFLRLYLPDRIFGGYRCHIRHYQRRNSPSPCHRGSSHPKILVLCN